MDTEIEVYEKVLSGKLKIFPKYFWKGEDGRARAIKITQYLINDKLSLSDFDIKNIIDMDFFKKHKLRGMIDRIKGGHLKLLVETFPFIKPWEFKELQKNYWNTEDNVKEVLEYLFFDKLNWTYEDVLKNVNSKTFKDNGFEGLLATYGSSTYRIIKILYPNLKVWELKDYHCQYGYWNEDTALDALEWLFVDKLNWNICDIKEKTSKLTFKENGLDVVLRSFFKDSPKRAIHFYLETKGKPENQ